MTLEDAVRNAVTAIEFDLTDRYGLRQAWIDMDAETREEIRVKWQHIIACAFADVKQVSP